MGWSKCVTFRCYPLLSEESNHEDGGAKERSHLPPVSSTKDVVNQTVCLSQGRHSGQMVDQILVGKHSS